MSIEKTEQREVMEALSTLKEVVEKKDAESLGNIEKINSYMDAQEKKSQELTTKLEAQKSSLDEFKGKMEAFEKIMSRPHNTSTEEKEAATALEFKALGEYLKGQSIDEYKNTLRTDIDPKGGYLVPDVLSNEIIKKITEISALRSICKVTTIQGKRLKKFVRTGLMSASIAGEAVLIPSSTSTYGTKSIDVYKLAVNAPVTHEELDDAAVNIQGEIMSDAVETFAQIEGNLLVKGNGANKPLGFMNDTSVGQFANGHATALSMAALIEMTGQIKTGYQGVYLLNRKTLAKLRTLTDSQGQFIWQAGNIPAGIPNNIGGYAYVEIPDMDDIASNAYPIVFGDFRKGFEIVDRKGITMLRDDYTKKLNDIVDFMFTKRFGGGVVQGEAIVKLKMATSV